MVLVNRIYTLLFIFLLFVCFIKYLQLLNLNLALRLNNTSNIKIKIEKDKKAIISKKNEQLLQKEGEVL